VDTEKILVVMKEIEQLDSKATIPAHADTSIDDIFPLYADEEDDEDFNDEEYEHSLEDDCDDDENEISSKYERNDEDEDSSDDDNATEDGTL
jgi:hypothetical protein